MFGWGGWGSEIRIEIGDSNSNHFLILLHIHLNILHTFILHILFFKLSYIFYKYKKNYYNIYPSI